MEVAAALQVQATAKGVQDTGTQLQEMAAKAKAAEKATKDFESQNKKADSGIKALLSRVTGLSGGLQQLAAMAGKLAGTLVAGLSIHAYIQLGDAWSDMSSKVGSAVKDMDAAPELMMRMVSLANASYSPLSQTVDVYTRNVAVLRTLGKTAAETADFTEALNHALVITATKGEAAASVQAALSKAMALGKLTGDGLETVLTHGGRVAEALGKQLGVPITGLRKLASEGKITSKVITDALLTSLEKLREEAAEMPATVADGMTRIATGVQAVVGVFDKLTGSTGSVAGVLVLIGDLLANTAIWLDKNGELVQDVFMTILGAALAYAGGLLAGYIVSMTMTATATLAAAVATGTLSGAFVVLKGAIAATGIGAAVLVAGFLLGQFLKLVSATGGFAQALTLLGEVAGIVWEGIGVAAQAVLPALQATWMRLKADFFDMVADLVWKWGEFLTLMARGASGLGMESRASALREAAAVSFSDSNSIAGGAEADRQGAYAKDAEVASLLGAGASKAKEGLDKLLATLRTTKDEVAATTATASGLGAALDDAGEKGKKATSKIKDGMKTLKDYTADFKSTLSSAFAGVLTGATSIKSALGTVIGKMAEMAATRGFELLWGGGLGKQTGGLLGALLGFAKGGVFSGGAVTAFADGGVVNGPTNFPMKNGIGLMGEAGPEAIMPLKRGADGKLGVQSGDGGKNIRITVEVLNNGNLRAIARDEAGNVIAESAPTIVRESVRQTGQAMSTSKTFGSPQ